MVQSAGLVMYRWQGGELQVLLVHPGGPFFRNRDDGVWSIPKGLVDPGEEPLACARREFLEETGVEPARDGFLDLGEIEQKGGKVVHAWAFAGDCDPDCVVSNTFPLEWPPRSGRVQDFPEVDRADFFSPPAARKKLNPAQVELVERLCTLLGVEAPSRDGIKGSSVGSGRLPGGREP